MIKSSRFLAGIVAAILASTLFMPTQAANAASITAASAVRSLVASDAWSSATPRTARAKLTWVRPASTYGATVVGYKIERSSNKTTWTTAISNTGSTSTSAIVSGGLRIASPNYFRVRAITKKGGSTKVGSASAVIARTLTAKPAAPALLGLTKITAPVDGTKLVRWLPQSVSQSGGLKVTYKVVAQSSGFEDVTCSTSTKSYCTLTGLNPAGIYTLKMSAKNSRGSEANLDEYQAEDSDLNLQWYLGTAHGVSVTRAWTATRGSKDLVVAVIDSGIVDHPELEGQLVPGYDFISDAKYDGDDEPGRDPNPIDLGDAGGNWHGTHVAGIIAAKSDKVGISGIAPKVKIQPIRVIGASGGSTRDLLDAMRWAAGLDVAGVPRNKTPARIINMSLVSDSPCSPQMDAAVREIEAAGVVIVTAAGNGSEDANRTPLDTRFLSPTGCPGPFSIGASGFSKDIAFYSNYNSDILAPGGDWRAASGDTSPARGLIYSLWNPEDERVLKEGFKLGYSSIAGTSMAAPMASGILALMISIRPDATVQQLKDSILNSVDRFAPGTFCSTRSDTYCGVGLINAATALEALIGITG